MILSGNNFDGGPTVDKIFWLGFLSTCAVGGLMTQRFSSDLWTCQE